MSCGVVLIHGSNPMLLWLGRRLAAVALIGPLAWELPYATCVALKSKTKKQTSKKETNKKNFSLHLQHNHPKFPNHLLTLNQHIIIIPTQKMKIKESLGLSETLRKTNT